MQFKQKKTTMSQKEWLDRFATKEKTEKKKEFVDPNTTFKPNIQKKSEKLVGERKVFDHLTEDSKKRIQKQQENDKNNAKKEKVAPKVNEKSKKVYHQKLMKDLNPIWQNDLGNSESISKDQIITLLKGLHFEE